MPHDDFEDWRTLCELAAKEEDPERLMDLVQRLNEALDQEERARLGHVSPSLPSKHASACDHCRKRQVSADKLNRPLVTEDELPVTGIRVNPAGENLLAR